MCGNLLLSGQRSYVHSANIKTRVDLVKSFLSRDYEKFERCNNGLIDFSEAYDYTFKFQFLLLGYEQICSNL